LPVEKERMQRRGKSIDAEGVKEKKENVGF